MSVVDFSKRSIIFITGASRGIGRAVAIRFSEIIHPQSVLVLIASTVKGLEETKAMIENKSNTLTVITYPLDLSIPSQEVYAELFDDVLLKVGESTLELSVLIHNAASLGVLKRTIKLVDESEWNKYYDLNFTSAVILNSCFVKRMNNLTKKLIINVSSDNAYSPYSSMSMYSSAKAARELFFKVFAVEQPQISVLNYAPGAVDTLMFDCLKNTIEDEEVKKVCQEITEQYLVQPQETADKLLSILQTKGFNSGDSIDYYLD